jgi:hypothetical protein
MVHNPYYDLHSWSKHYREERLAEANGRYLVERARTSREPRGLRRVGLAWSNALTLLQGA